MSKSPSYAALPPVARGYANCLVSFRGLVGPWDAWRHVSVDDFTRNALASLEADCLKFLAAAKSLPGYDQVGLDDETFDIEIGWRFFSTRQGVGLGYQGLVPGRFGRGLCDLAETFPKVEVALRSGKIVFLN